MSVLSHVPNYSFFKRLQKRLNESIGEIILKILFAISVEIRIPTYKVYKRNPTLNMHEYSFVLNDKKFLNAGIWNNFLPSF